MSENNILLFTDPEMQPIERVKRLRSTLAQIKAQQAPTIRFTDVSTVSFDLRNIGAGFDLYNTETHCVAIMTLDPPGEQVLFAIPEVDVFVGNSSIPSLQEVPATEAFLFPTGNMGGSAFAYEYQFISVGVWYDYLNSDGKNIVAKVFVRNRSVTDFDHPAPHYLRVKIATRWRYMVPGSTATQEGIQYPA